MASFEMPNGFAPFTAEHPPRRAANGANHAIELEKPASVSGILEVEVLQAKNLHNICIYARQDVYARISLNDAVGAEPTAFYTEVVDKGGRDPVFNEKFSTSLVQSDRVLRCEVFMASKMRDYLQDQLLGAVNIPLSTLVGKDKQYNEFELSSTELFHSPAGSISLALKFCIEGSISSTTSSQSNECEVTVCNSTTSNLSAGSDSGIDSKLMAFQDLADAQQDEELVSDFMWRKQCVEAAKVDGIYTGPPFLKLDASVDDNTLAQEEEEQDPTVVNGNHHVPELDSPTDEHSVIEEGGARKPGSSETEKPLKVEVVTTPTSSSLLESTVTPSSQPKTAVAVDEVEKSEKAGAPSAISEEEAAKYGCVSKPVIQPEPRIVQQDIMDMYTKSMQQFSEALARMQLPVDENGLIKLDEPSSETSELKNTNIDAANNSSSGSESGDKSAESGGGKKNAANTPRVFYGTRAFF